MADKRATTPLFDLLQQGRARGVESRPVETPETRAPAPARGEPRGGGYGEAPIRIDGGVVRMPLVYAAVALATALAAVLVAWTLGYQRGDRHARQEERLRESALSPGARIIEPGSGGSAPSQPGGGGAARSPQPPETPIPDPGGRQIQAVGSGRYLTAAGSTDADPRSPDHNYLTLGASIRAGEVASAIEFLAQRGIECFGVIESGTSRGNDGPLYEMFAGQGFSRDRVDSSEARQYREQVVAAGAAWKAAGGVRSFDDAYWKLYRR